jgi:glutamate synthase (NADPH/NADH) small chain
MSDIEHKDRGSLIGPLKALGFLGRQPVTEPLGPRPASANYRGFHVNDWDLCIGCSTCQKVCDNAAITMVRIPSLPADEVKGIRNERPAIDYGRCCWCGLCVDICPTGSIALSREYVHVCREDELDSYFVLPDPNGIHNQHFEKGWAKTADADLVDLNRQPMTELKPASRSDNFDEIVAGFTEQQAIIEASRCVQCGMCHDACPTNMHAPEYIRAIWQGDIESAVEWIYQTNPFAHVCGRVCTHRCEDACSIGRRGEPVAIRWLKRYAMDALPDEKVREIAARGKADSFTGFHVAIIGAGPAGLTAAYDLVREGHRVTVFEALDRSGGMTRYGIPEYRLPYDRLDADVAVIESLGVEIRCNVRIGEDISMAQLQSDYDAVLISVGLQQGRSTRIPGSDHDQVYRAVDLLRNITTGKKFDVPKKAVVVGGGNVAMDIARSLARLQKQAHGKVQLTVTALEDIDNFLADPEEIREAREEGIVIMDNRGPMACEIRNDGKLHCLKTHGVISVFDDKGRFAPRYDETDEQLYDADMIVESIGQMTDTSVLGEELVEQLEWNRGRLQIDEKGCSSESWLWAAGDMVNGPDVVHAVADGHRVAAGIHGMLTAQEASK